MIDRRARDAAVILPIAGALLFLPPYIKVFDQDVFIFGLPLLPIFIFSIWFVGLVLTALLARRLVRILDGSEHEHRRQPPPPHFTMVHQQQDGARPYGRPPDA